MYKFETLAMDGDGNYFAIFKHTDKRVDRLIYDYQGLMHLQETDDYHHIDETSFNVAITNLVNINYRRYQKERTI